ncbi:phage integrase [Erwinia billingiae]
MADDERRQGLMALHVKRWVTRPRLNSMQRFSTAYREKCLIGKLTLSSRVKTVAPRKANLELAYFRAMFKELRRLDERKAPNPLENIREFRFGESEMAYLTTDEIRGLLAECDKSRSPDLTAIVKICLATGARWSEAEGLKGNQVRAGQIIYVKTKGKKNRAVPITEKLLAELPASCKAQPLFTPCYSAFRKAMQRAGIEDS